MPDILSFEKKTDNVESGVPDQIQNLGYETSNPTENLGTIALLTVLYFIRIVYFFLMVSPIKRYTRHGHKYHKSLSQKLFYGEILIILIEGFLDFTIAFFLYGFYDPINEKGLSYFVCVVIFFMVFVVLPGTILQVIFEDKETLQSSAYKNMYGTLYEELRIKEKKQVAFYLFFIFRRFIFVFVSLYLREQSYF